MLSQSTGRLEKSIFALLVTKLPAVNVSVDTNSQIPTLCVTFYNPCQAKLEAVRQHTEPPNNTHYDGFGGLVVRMLASGSRVRGLKPGRSRWIFLYIKILSMPSFGGEVK
jgi:hypothetical protein